MNIVLHLLYIILKIIAIVFLKFFDFLQKADLPLIQERGQHFGHLPSVRYLPSVQAF